jgi:hypothetical protein
MSARNRQTANGTTGSRGYNIMKRMKFSTLAAAVSLALAGGQVAHAQCSIPGNVATPFQAGQPNPNNGFAEFVTDTNGLALELCLDPAFCFFDPVVAGNTFSEQIGFGAEAFWWLAEATLNTAGPAGTLDAIVVMAAEAAFALENPVDGEQFPFTRLRIRIDVPAPGIYTVTHPYGTEEFTVTTVGAGQEVRTSADISFVPGPAGGTTQNEGCVAPWLQWDPAESAPPAGFIGDGATPHTVIGGPVGNSFTISATDLAGNPIDLDGVGNNSVSTDQFIVNGKLFDGALATPIIADRTTYERDAAASTGQLDVFATAAKFATVSFNGGANLPAGDIPMVSDPADPRVSDADSSKFFASTLLTPDATVVPPLVEFNATDTATDATRLLRLVSDVVTITKAEYNTASSTLTVEANSSDANLTPALTVEGYGVPIPAEIVTAAPPATINVTSSVGGTDEAHVTVVDNTPPLAVDDTATTSEGVEVTIDVVANDVDTDGINPATVTIVSSTTNGLAINNGDGNIRYIPFANFNGTDSLTYRVADNTGILSNVATVSITVNGVNNAPVAVADSATTDNATPVIINVLANDSDVDGDALTVTAVTTPANGTAVINADNTITYTTTTIGFIGIDTFDYTVEDGNGGSATATVTVSVFDVNAAPTATDDVFTVNEDSGANNLDVLLNDTDPENDTLNITAITQPAPGTGTVVNNGTSVTYNTATNFNGNTSFSYTINDGNGNSDTAVITVNVAAVNDNPFAFSDAAATTAGTPVVINVLGNDLDVDGDALTVTAVTAPSNGTAVINADNTITYTSTADFAGGNVTFNYTVSDGNGGTATSTVTVNVSAVAGQVDLDITRMQATGRVRGAGQAVNITLGVRLVSAVGGDRPATVIGVDSNGTEVFRQTLQVNDQPGRGSTNFTFGPYITNGNEGTITWTATLVDDDPDLDQATDTTVVR